MKASDNAKAFNTYIHAPDGGKDENVFDIQQGVAICLMVKHPQEVDQKL